MLETFVIVFRQTMVVVLLMAIGYFCGKKKILDDASAAGINRFVCTFVTTCATISGFMVETSPERIRHFFIGMIAAAGLHLMNYVLARVIFPKKSSKSWLCRGQLMLVNCGFIGFPMLTAVLGEDGIFYGLPFCALMAAVSWTAGVAVVSGDLREIHGDKLLKSAPLWGVAAGLLLFVLSVTLPPVLGNTVGFLSALNTPLPMILVGYYMIGCDFRPLLKDGSFWLTAGLRLLVMPLLSLVLLWLCGVNGKTLTAMVICNACPTGAMISLLAGKYDRDTAVASTCTSLQTLLSVLTMPPVIAVSALLA